MLRGSGGFFCAGGHLGGFQEEQSPAATALRNRSFGAFMQRLAGLPLPVIAAVEGAAMGGGMGLACAADIVLANEGARFALSETSLGVIPAQIAPFVVERIGARAARRLGLSGERVSGEAARQIGLVDDIAADGAALDALLARWLTRICACAPRANRALKGMLRRCGHDDQGALLDEGARLFAACLHDEGVEGVAAFREKRAAVWCRMFTADEVREACA